MVRDTHGNLIDPYNPTVDIWDPDGVLYSYNHAPVREDRGEYYYIWDIPITVLAGVWKAEWKCVIDGFELTSEQEFELVAPAEVTSNSARFMNNNLYKVTISGNIKSLDGDILEENEYVEFTYGYKPFFTDVDTVRAYSGHLADDLSDMYISMLILDNSQQALDLVDYYWRSNKEFDPLILPNGPKYDPDKELYEQAIGKYLECYTRWKTIEDIILGKIPDFVRGLGAKSLGDFSISKFGKDIDAWNSLLDTIRPKLERCYEIISGESLNQVDAHTTIKSSTSGAVGKHRAFQGTIPRGFGIRW